VEWLLYTGPGTKTTLAVEDSVHRVGGGGYFTLLFKTIRISKSELQLKYGRGWDPQDVPMDSFLVTIVVK
jgi:predicted secreted protein